MKKSIFSIFALCVLFSCAKDMPVYTLEDLSINASLGSEGKSSYFGEGSLVWNYYDKISILDGQGNREFTTYASDSQPSATFFGQVSSPWTKLIGIYPYHSGNKLLSDGNVLMNFPSCQIAAPGGFTDGANPSIGVTTSASSLLMKNAGAYVKFNFTSSKDVRMIYLVPNARSINVSGLMTVKPSTAELVSTDEGSNCVSLVPGGDAYIVPGTYYFAVPPVKFDNGLRMFFRMADGKLLCKTGKSTVRLLRNRTLDLGTIEVDKLPVAVEKSMDREMVILDFSGADKAFTAALPKNLTEGETKYYTKTGNYPVSFLVSPVEEGGNSRGSGWKCGTCLVFQTNNYWQDNNTEYLDGITLPAIPGKCLVRVEIETPSNSFPMNVTDNVCRKVFYDDDYATKPSDKYNSSENWLKGTHGFTLPLTNRSESYRLVARKTSSFCNLLYVFLYYETIEPKNVSTIAEPLPDDTKPEIGNVGFEPIDDGEPVYAK